MIGSSGKARFVMSGSNSQRDRLGEFLVRKGVLTESEVTMALAVLPRFNGRFGEALVALKLFSPAEVSRHLTDHMRSRAVSSLLWSDASVQFFSGEAPPAGETPVQLEPIALIAQAVQQLDAAVLSERIEELRDHRLTAAVPAPFPAERFGMGQEPRLTYNRLNGKNTVRELLDRFDDDTERLGFARLVYLLFVTGLAEISP